MSDYFYDGQVKRYLTQFMRLMSNFSYKDAKGQLVEVPVRYGDMSRQVGNILKKNSENIMQSAPFISCYIKDLQHDRNRMQDPTFISKVQIREREFNEETGEYSRNQGGGYTVERLMPTPYLVTFSADIWSTNTDQKLQLWEQIVVFFNPSLELQSSDNYIDWSSLSVVELVNQTFETRTVPQGLEGDISVASLQFNCPIWINPPAKVKKLGIITKVISNVFVSDALNGVTEDGAYKDISLTNLFTGDVLIGKSVITPGNFGLLVLNNTAALLPIKESVPTELTSTADLGNKQNWYSILDLYPGQFRAGLSQLRLRKEDGTEIVGYIGVNPADDFIININFDADTVPGNTILAGRGTVDAIIDPQKFNPVNKVAGTRYLTLEDINPDRDTFPGYSGPQAWKNVNTSDFKASANDIIEWDGVFWNIVFDSNATRSVIYITNTFTGIQYKWNNLDGVWQWSKSYEGIYDPGSWRLVL
jgi:hypothetical protein